MMGRFTSDGGYSTRVLAAAAAFGVDVTELTPPRVDREVEAPLEPGSVVLITGPSGGGKSALLARLTESARAGGRRVIGPGSLRRPADRPLVDLIPGELNEVIRLLARAGLAEARLLALKPSQLSRGQQFRFMLARLMNMAERSAEPCIIAVDEFASTLDEWTARGVCRSAARWVRRGPHTLLAAGCASVLTEALAPDVLVVKPLDMPAEVSRG